MGRVGVVGRELAAQLLPQVSASIAAQDEGKPACRQLRRYIVAIHGAAGGIALGQRSARDQSGGVCVTDQILSRNGFDGRTVSVESGPEDLRGSNRGGLVELELQNQSGLKLGTVGVGALALGLADLTHETGGG